MKAIFARSLYTFDGETVREALLVLDFAEANVRAIIEGTATYMFKAAFAQFFGH